MTRSPVTDDSHAPMRRGFTALLCSLFLVDLGSAMTGIALPLLVANDYGLSFTVGMTFAISILPRIVVSPFTGSAMVRYDPRRIAIVSALLSAPFIALVPLTHTLWQLQLLNLIVSVGDAVAGPSRLALRPLTIAEGAELSGNGLLVAAERVPVVLGPALVGGIEALGLGVSWVFLVPSVSAMVAALLVFRVPARKPGQPAEAVKGSAPGTVGPGYFRGVTAHARMLIETISRDKFIAGLTLTALTYVAAVSVGRILLLTLAQSRFGATSGTFGWLLASMSLGAVLGATLTGRLGSFSYGLLYIAGNCLEAAVWVGLIAIHERTIAIGVLFLAGFLESIATVVFFAAVQRGLPPEIVGYYYAVIMPFTGAASVAGYLVGGVLASQGVTALAWCVAALIAAPVLMTAPWYRSQKEQEKEKEKAGADILPIMPASVSVGRHAARNRTRHDSCQDQSAGGQPATGEVGQREPAGLRRRDQQSCLEGPVCRVDGDVRVLEAEPALGQRKPCLIGCFLGTEQQPVPVGARLGVQADGPRMAGMGDCCGPVPGAVCNKVTGRGAGDSSKPA